MLLFLTVLLGRVERPLLPHVSVHQPIQVALMPCMLYPANVHCFAYCSNVLMSGNVYLMELRFKTNTASVQVDLLVYPTEAGV